jgi:hypothetical protein
VPLAISIGIIIALLFVMWVAFAKEPGPGPADVAIAYEQAWDGLDFGLLYDLSGDEMRDGMRRDQFIAAKKAAYARSDERGRLGATVTVDDLVASGQTAAVATRVHTDEGEVQNRVLLEKRANGWMVVGYSIRTA